MVDVTQAHPLSDFLKNHQVHLARLKATGAAEILTVDGRAEVVVVDAERFQELLARLERAELVEAIRDGLASAERDGMKPVEQVHAEMCARYGIQR